MRYRHKSNWRNKRKRRGMRIGGRHSWTYKTGLWNERKIGRRKWAITYYQTKTRRGHKAKPWQGMPTGSKIAWAIKAKQYATKITPNKYKLVMKGIKYQDAYKLPRHKWQNTRPKR